MGFFVLGFDIREVATELWVLGVIFSFYLPCFGWSFGFRAGSGVMFGNSVIGSSFLFLIGYLVLNLPKFAQVLLLKKNKISY